jgi:hypothetical protein
LLVGSSSSAKTTYAIAASRTSDLIIAAITLWNTVYLERAIATLREHGIAIDEESLAHLSPIGWEHGDYTWQVTGRLRNGAFRPPRPFAASNK